MTAIELWEDLWRLTMTAGLRLHTTLVIKWLKPHELKAEPTLKFNSYKLRLKTHLLTLLFTAQCTLVHSAVLRSHVVRLSVCNVGGL